MPSFSTPLSGLNADSQDLSVIANNLANLNTVGYKDATSQIFRISSINRLTQTGRAIPYRSEWESQISSIAGNFTQGSIQATGVPTDLAIQGNGFLVNSNNGLQEFTRAGNLSVTANGSLVTADGGLVQGYEAVNGIHQSEPNLGGNYNSARIDQPAQIRLPTLQSRSILTPQRPLLPARPANNPAQELPRPQFSRLAACWPSRTGPTRFRIPRLRTTH